MDVVGELLRGGKVEMIALGLEEMENEYLYCAEPQGTVPGPWQKYCDRRNFPRYDGESSWKQGTNWNRVRLDAAAQKELHDQFTRRYPRYKDYHTYWIDCRNLETPGQDECGLRNHCGTHMVTLWRIMTSWKYDLEQFERVVDQLYLIFSNTMLHQTVKTNGHQLLSFSFASKDVIVLLDA